ncbi:hypothetical protein AVEN_58034-1, partial [Araneus ventricosus]
MARTAPEQAHPRQIFAPHQRDDVLPLMYDLTYNRRNNTTYLQWNRVSNLEPSGTKAETLPLGHRGLMIIDC